MKTICCELTPLLAMQPSFTSPQNEPLCKNFDEAYTQIEAAAKCIMLTLYKTKQCQWFERYYTLSNIFHQTLNTLKRLYLEFTTHNWKEQIITTEQKQKYQVVHDLEKIFSKDDIFEFSLYAEHQPQEMAYTLINCVFINNPLFEGFEKKAQTAFNDEPKLNPDYFTDNTLYYCTRRKSTNINRRRIHKIFLYT